jgi:hypothetical protein
MTLGNTGNLTLTDSGSSNINFNLSSTGDFTIQDNGTNFAQFLDTGQITLGSTLNTNVLINPNAGGQAALIVDKLGGNDILTASASGTPRFTITNPGAIKLGTNEGISTQCLTSGGAGAAALWSTCLTGSGSQWWTLNAANGTIYPVNSTVDLLVGGTASSSAKFAVLNVNSGTPTASVSAGASSAGAAYLTAAGTLQTTQNQTLTLGGNTTGNIVIEGDAGNRIGIGTTATPLAGVDIRGTGPSFGTTAIASVSGATSFAALTVDNSGVGDLFTASSSGNTLFVVRKSGVVLIGNSTNGLTFDYINGGPTYAGTARPTKKLVLSPEYAGATLTASGSANITGDMTSDASPSASWRTYYEWTSTQTALHDYTVAVRATLPSDFSAWATTNALQIDYNTELTTSDTNKLDVLVYNPSDTPATPVVMRTANVSATVKTWTTLNIDDSAITGTPAWNTAGQSAVIYLRMYAKDTNYVQIGDVVLNYLSKF